MLRMVCFALSVSACATAPTPHEVRHTSLIKASRDTVWDALVAELAEKGWGVATIDRTSGLLATQWLRVPDTYADCGSAPLANVAMTRVRLSIVVTSADDGANFSVNTTFQQLRTFGESRGVVECYSTGRVEELVTEHIAARVYAAAGAH